MVDGELLKLADLDLEFISTNAGIKNQALNPDRALVRYQVMEVLVRIAIQKYFKSKLYFMPLNNFHKVNKWHIKVKPYKKCSKTL